MLCEQAARGIAIEAEAGRGERLLAFERRLAPRSAVPREQFDHLRVAAMERLVEQRLLTPSLVPRGRSVGARAVRQRPFGELQLVVANRMLEDEPRAESVSAHVDHPPLRIGPVGLAAEGNRAVVDQIEQPNDVVVQRALRDVVEHLSVVRIGAALEQQRGQRARLRVQWRALFSLTDDERQRGVVDLLVAAVKVRLRIGAAIEQQARDGDRVVGERRQRQASGAQVEQRRPVLRTEDVPRRARSLRQHPLDAVAIAADDARDEVRIGDVGMPAQDPLGGVAVHHLMRSATHAPVRSGVLEEPVDVGRPVGRRRCHFFFLNKPPIASAAFFFVSSLVSAVLTARLTSGTNVGLLVVP